MPAAATATPWPASQFRICHGLGRAPLPWWEEARRAGPEFRLAEGARYRVGLRSMAAPQQPRLELRRIVEEAHQSAREAIRVAHEAMERAHNALAEAADARERTAVRRARPFFVGRDSLR